MPTERHIVYTYKNVTIKNSYCLDKDTGIWQFVQDGSDSTLLEDINLEKFVDLLNNNAEEAPWIYNENGYPTLKELEKKIIYDTTSLIKDLDNTESEYVNIDGNTYLAIKIDEKDIIGNGTIEFKNLIAYDGTNKITYLTKETKVESLNSAEKWEEVDECNFDTEKNIKSDGTIKYTNAIKTYKQNLKIEKNWNVDEADNYKVSMELYRIIKKSDVNIEYIEDLVELSKSVQAGTNYFGQVITLDKTLDFENDNSYRNPQDASYGDLNGDGIVEGIKAELTNKNRKGFTPIGTANESFNGTFNGMGNEIQNVYINSTSKCVGLFGNVKYGNIANLGITGEINSTKDENAYVGSIAGYIYDGTIENCYSKATISTENNMSFLGGIVGLSKESNINKCYNLGKVNDNSTFSYVGGITGYSYSSTMINSYNAKEISCNGKSSRIGGISGYIYDSSISNCYNTGEISGNNYVGGIVGYVYGVNSIANTYNTGKIESEGYAGGIAGRNSNSLKIENTNYLETVAETGIYDAVYEGLSISDEYIKSEEFIYQLNNYAENYEELLTWENKNGTYPTLKTENEQQTTEIATIDGVVYEAIKIGKKDITGNNYIVFEDLPIFENNEKIKYLTKEESIQKLNVAGQYEKLNSNDFITTKVVNDETIKYTNTKKTSFTAEKQWNVEEPENYKVTFNLYKITGIDENGNNIIQEVVNSNGDVISKEVVGNGKTVFEDLPAYENETKIQYTVKEAKVQKKKSNGEWKTIDLKNFSIEKKQNEDGTITFVNTIVEGNYAIVLTKVDKNGEIISDEDTRFKVNAYKSITEEDGKVEFTEQISTVYDTDGNEINIQDLELTATKGTTTELNKIDIQKDEINNTYYFVIEEIQAPYKYEAINYKIVLPVTYSENKGKYIATQGEAFAIDNEGNKLSLTEVAKENKVSVKQSEKIINITIPNAEKKSEFDLAIRQSITGVERAEEDITSQLIKENRLPVLNATSLEGLHSDKTTMYYYHPKTAVYVNKGDIITYTIRVYNEGKITGYANKVTSYIPEGLEFIESTLNTDNGWKALKDENNKVIGIYTNVLASEANGGSADNAINSIQLGEDNSFNVDYKEIKLQLRVKAITSDEIEAVYLTNRCEITEYGYFNREEEWIEASEENVDKDSIENTILKSIGLENWYATNVVNSTLDVENYYPGIEDDDDFETVAMKQVKTNVQLNKLSSASLNNISGATFSIQGNNVKIEVQNKNTHEKIEKNESGNYLIPEDGITIGLSGLLVEQKYNITITEISAPQGFEKTFGYLTLEVYVDSEETTHAKIVELYNKDGEAEDIQDSEIAILEDQNSDGSVEIKLDETYDNLTIQYALNSLPTKEDEWITYNGSITLYENAIIYARTVTKSGKVSGIAEKIVNNIDKRAPVVSDIETTFSDKRIGTLTAKLKDLISKEDVAENLPKYGASGIISYAFSESNIEEPKNKTLVNQEINVDIEVGNIYKSGTYYIWVYDAAGNCTIQEVEIIVPEIMVARIIDVKSTDGNNYSDLIGTEYATLEEALAVCPELGNGTAKIQMINNTAEANTVNKDVTIDLNGYTISMHSTNDKTPTITITEGGNLTVIDTKGEGIIQNKKSEFSNYEGSSIAIYVTETGTFTLGEDNSYVSTTEPRILGEGYSIYVEKSGEFNFYDGKIEAATALVNKKQVTTAIYGNVDGTPAVYSVSVTNHTEPEKKQIAVLGLVSGIEARIGRKTYTKLETAIEEAGTVYGIDGSQVEVVLEADLSKENTVIVDKTKNIKLDLNGHMFTTVSKGYALENYGKLEIIDSSEEQTGLIIGAANSTIYNGSNNEYTGDEVPVDLSEVKKYNEDDEYYLEYNSERKQLINNNTDDKTTAISYLELDLTEYDGQYEIIVDAEMFASGNAGGGYVSISNSKPQGNSTYGRFISCEGRGYILSQDCSCKVAGGQKYYLNFTYKQSVSNGGFSGKFCINRVSLKKIKSSELTLTSGSIKTETYNTSAISNEGVVNINGGNLIANGSNSKSISTLAGAITNINDGNITSKAGAVYASGIASLTKIKGGNIEGSIYGLGSSNLSTSIVTGGNFSGNCKYQIYDEGYGSFIVLDGITLEKTNSEYCIFSGRYNNSTAVISNGKFIINNCTISNNANYSIRLYNTDVDCEINNTSISGKYGIYLNSGNLKIDDSEINTKGEAFACAKPGKSTSLEILNSKVEVQNSYIINMVDISNITIIDSILTNESSTSNYSGIFANIKYKSAIGNTNINILGNTSITTKGSIVSSIGTGTIVVGTKDGNVSNEKPVLKTISTNRVIDAPRMEMNFYDGILVGKQELEIRIPIIDFEEGYQLVSNLTEDGFEEVTLGHAIDVAQIVETGERYGSLKQAVIECGENDYTIQLIKNVREIDNIKIEANQNIVIDLNGHKIETLTDDMITVYGKFKLIDSSKTLENNILDYVGFGIINCNSIEENGEISNGTAIIGDGINIYVDLVERLTDINYIIKNSGDIILDGCKIDFSTTCNGIGAIKNYDSGDLVIQNSEINAQGVATVYKTDNYGRNELESAVTYGIYNMNSANVTLNSGTVSYNAYYGAAIYSTSEGLIKVQANNNNNIFNIIARMPAKSGTNRNCESITACGIYDKSGELTIENVNINIETAKGIQSLNKNIIYDATITGKGKEIGINLNGESTIYDCTVNNTTTGIINAGNLNIVNAELTVSSTGISNSGVIQAEYFNITAGGSGVNNTGTVNIMDCDINSTGKLTNTAGINNTAILNITDGRITASLNGIYNGNSATLNVINAEIISNQRHGIENNKSTANIIGGTITSKLATSNNGYGIYNNNSGILNLGEKITDEGLENGEEPSITFPKITGNSYGLYNNNSTVNFYDGAITGASEKSIFGTITDKETDYEIVKIDNGDGTETARLKKNDIAEIIDVDGKTVLGLYTTATRLQQGINDLESKESPYTIRVVSDFSIIGNEKIEILENLKIVLDLNGKTIRCSNTHAITNNGTLTIKDSSEEQIGNILSGAYGTIDAYADTIINGENANIIIESGKITTISQYSHCINNNGTIIIRGGEVIATDQLGNGIYNNSGTVTVDGGKVLVEGESGRAIHNNIGTVNMNAGEILARGTGGNGIYNNEGTVTIIGGKVESSPDPESMAFQFGNDGTAIHNQNGIINVKENAQIINYRK